MGRIEENRKKRKEGNETKNPLSEIGNRNVETNDFDIDKRTIKDQQKKK